MLLSHRLFTTTLCIALACKGTESQFVMSGRDKDGSTERFLEVNEHECDTATNDAVNWFINLNNHPDDLGTDERVWRVSIIGDNSFGMCLIVLTSLSFCKY